VLVPDNSPAGQLRMSELVEPPAWPAWTFGAVVQVVVAAVAMAVVVAAAVAAAAAACCQSW